jgi:hypothetical protein
VYQNDQTAQAAVAGMYSTMYATATYLYKLRATTGNAADEFYQLQGSTYNQYRNNAIATSNNDVLNAWSGNYAVIYKANAILEGLDHTGSGVSAALARQLKGEALFIRAFCHFYLVNLFGKVPLITSTDIAVTALAPRTSVDSVYKQVIADLEQAAAWLPDTYAFTGGDRSHATHWAAEAMLARAYLYTGNWLAAETAAGKLIDQKALYGLPALETVFLANSKEAIWQFNTVGAQDVDGYSYEGYNFINGSDKPTFVLTGQLAAAFEPGDQRKASWLGVFPYNGSTYYYPYKYKLNEPPAGTLEYQMVLRLAEQYLVRAEARAQQNNVDGARADLDSVRVRAGLGLITANDRPALLLAVEQERRVELFLEYGHRWFDLKRTGRANAVLGAFKTGWTPEAVLFPVPLKAINANPNLLPNNLGYK